MKKKRHWEYFSPIEIPRWIFVSAPTYWIGRNGKYSSFLTIGQPRCRSVINNELWNYELCINLVLPSYHSGSGDVCLSSTILVCEKCAPGKCHGVIFLEPFLEMLFVSCKRTALHTHTDINTIVNFIFNSTAFRQCSRL